MTTLDPARIIEDAVLGLPLVLCTIEGCPRVTVEGQDQECGLCTLARQRFGNPFAGPDLPGCGACDTTDLWSERGLLFADQGGAS